MFAFAFWAAAAALSAAAAWLMLNGSRAASRRAAGEDPTLAVHRRQLAEIEDLAARGLLPEAEMRAARAEAGRRLLAAADAANRQGVAMAATTGRRIALAAAIAAPLAAAALYMALGHPGMADRPYAARLEAWRASDIETLELPKLAAILRAVTAERPNDAEAFHKLATVELAAGDPLAAGVALRRAVSLAPDRPELWALLGETFVVQADGRVDADARRAFGEALNRDPGNTSARYFLARGDIQDGKVEQGLAGWRALLASLPSARPDEQATREALASEIKAVEAAGGLPTPAQAAAASGAVPDEKAIRGMVEGLAARLETQPMDPEGWVRLVRAWSVLGETGKRDAALARAKGLFKDRPDVQQALDRAAETPR